MDLLCKLSAVVILALIAAGARAQNVAHGQQIYLTSCFACHGPASANVNTILTTGANNPGAILAAWQNIPAMNGFVSLYNASDRADIAAYLGTFLPASGEIRASTTQLNFGDQVVGTRSATQTVTISNFTGSVAITGVANNDAPEFPIVADTCSGATLGASATCHIDVAFNPAALGPRGTTIMISNGGVVNPLSFTAIGTGVANAPAVNYQGLWWNPAESGWGVNLAHQGDLLYLTWYTYDATGKASWLAMLASKTAPGTYSGDILEVRGSPYTTVPFNPNVKVVATVGHGTLSFTSATAGTFAYTAKNVTTSKAITKLSLGGPVPVCTYSATPNLAGATNYQDLWSNAAEDGWGLNITHEGSVIYATWYTYDTDGSALWVAALMTPTAPGTWSGSLVRGTGPPFGPTFDPSLVQLPTVGTATLTFANGNAATWSYSLNSTVGTKTMTRTLFGAPAATMCQ